MAYMSYHWFILSVEGWHIWEMHWGGEIKMRQWSSSYCPPNRPLYLVLSAHRVINHHRATLVSQSASGAQPRNAIHMWNPVIGIFWCMTLIVAGCCHCGHLTLLDLMLATFFHECCFCPIKSISFLYEKIFNEFCVAGLCTHVHEVDNSLLTCPDYSSILSVIQLKLEANFNLPVIISNLLASQSNWW